MFEDMISYDHKPAYFEIAYNQDLSMRIRPFTNCNDNDQDTPTGLPRFLRLAKAIMNGSCHIDPNLNVSSAVHQLNHETSRSREMVPMAVTQLA